MNERKPQGLVRQPGRGLLARREFVRQSAAMGLVAPLAAQPFGIVASPPGRIVEIDLPEKLGSTHELAAAPDGAIWVSQMTQHRLVRISADGEQVRIFEMPPGTGPHGLRFNSRGRLWLTFQLTDEIVEIAPDGGILARHKIPSPGAGPHGLAIGRDDAVWWTGKTGNMIGRFDPATGATTIHPLGQLPATPIYINAGADGSMWFTELEGSRLGRIDAAGRMTIFDLPTPNARPIAVLNGPDAQIWFTEERGNAYGRVTMDGRVEEFPTGVVGGELASAVFDDAGDLWLQFNTPDIIQRVRAGAATLTFQLPTSNAVQHRIIIGADGRIWFTELASDKVGYMFPP